MATESAVSVPNTGTKAVRTIEITTYAADGTATVVEVQAVILSDSGGNIFDFGALVSRLDDASELLLNIASILEQIRDKRG